MSTFAFNNHSKITILRDYRKKQENTFHEFLEFNIYLQVKNKASFPEAEMPLVQEYL